MSNTIFHEIPYVEDAGDASIERLRTRSGDVYLSYQTANSAGTPIPVCLVFRRVAYYRYVQHGYWRAPPVHEGRPSGQVMIELLQSELLDRLYAYWSASYGACGRDRPFDGHHFEFWVWDEGLYEIIAESFEVIQGEACQKMLGK